MSESGEGRHDPSSNEGAEPLGSALAGARDATAGAWERQMPTIFAMSAILAALPQAADIDLKKVGVAIQLLAAKQADPERLRDEMTRVASFIINLSRRLRDLDMSSPASQTPNADPGTGDERA